MITLTGGRPGAVRVLVAVSVLVAAFLASTGSALGHAYLVRSDPPADAKLAASPARVTLTFSEPVELLDAGDLDVLDADGRSVTAGSGRGDAADARRILAPLTPGLPEGTYTVRYTILGADSHVIPGVYVFGVGPGELGKPFAAAIEQRGPSEAGPWGVSSRFLELAGVGGLIGLIGFRFLVWAPALRRSGPMIPDEHAAALAWGRDVFWMGFALLAVGAMLAEAYVLVVQSASVLGTGVAAALGDATGIAQVLGSTRFGSLVQLRGALLFGVFALGAIVFLREYGRSGELRAAGEGGSPLLLGAAGALLLAVLGSIAAQGHPAVAPLAPLQVGSQLVHVAAVSVWVVGLCLFTMTALRLPRVAPVAGPAVSARVMARFSRVAMAAVVLAIATGVVRSVTELGAPDELWGTAYGRSILYKLLLLVPVAFLALYNRRIVAALRGVERPNAATLRLVRTTATIELAILIGIVLIATLLVAQVPGAP